MSKAISIHIGLNHIDKNFYGRDGQLNGCENDATFMQSLAKSRGFETTLLLSSQTITDANNNEINQTSYDNVIKEIVYARSNLSDDGILLITFSGHGTQSPDGNNGILDSEPDGQDECWMLFDGLLVDDTIFAYLTDFKPSQRVVIISDSCNSGSVSDTTNVDFPNNIKGPISEIMSFQDLVAFGIDIDNMRRAIINLNYSSPISYDFARLETDDIRLRDIGVSVNTFLDANLPKRILPGDLKDFFSKNNEKIKELETKAKDIVRAKMKEGMDFHETVESSVIVLSACQDWQIAKDGNEHGVFTQALKDVLVEKEQIEIENETGKVTWLNAGNLNYLQLYDEVTKKLKSNSQKQSPNYTRLGIPNSAFEMQNVFDVDVPV